MSPMGQATVLSSAGVASTRCRLPRHPPSWRPVGRNWHDLPLHPRSTWSIRWATAPALHVWRCWADIWQKSGGRVLPGSVASLPGHRQRLAEHARREPSRERILLARVITADQPIRADDRFCTVPEARFRPNRMPQVRERPEGGIPAERAKRDHHGDPVEQRELAGQERCAGVPLLDGGLVRRRSTAVSAARDAGSVMPLAPRCLLEQQLVKPARGDEQPDDAHRHEIHNMEEQDRREGTHRE